jgi:hypothetical protein
VEDTEPQTYLSFIASPPIRASVVDNETVRVSFASHAGPGPTHVRTVLGAVRSTRITEEVVLAKIPEGLVALHSTVWFPSAEFERSTEWIPHWASGTVVHEPLSTLYSREELERQMWASVQLPGLDCSLVALANEQESSGSTQSILTVMLSTSQFPNPSVARTVTLRWAWPKETLEGRLTLRYPPESHE